MYCHHTVLRYGLQLETGRKRRQRSREAVKATADSAGGGGGARKEEGRLKEKQGCRDNGEKLR